MKLRKGLPPKLTRLVIKLGSRAVTNEAGGPNLQNIKKIVSDVSALKASGIECILVCSGAIHTARALVKKEDYSKQKEQVQILQALSSIGQPHLMAAINDSLKEHKLVAGQILLTHEDFKNSTRYFNLKNTIEKLLQWNCIPVVNENDSISFSEITVGDNDQLAAMIAENLEAGALLMLSETDGLYTKNPTEADALPIPYIEYSDGLESVQTISKNNIGRGGMLTKLQSVRKLSPLGIPVVIASYVRDNPILSALSKEDVGSIFAAKEGFKNKRKSRMLARVKTNVEIKIDQGAALAIQKNKSLLPVGVIKFEGHFLRGDVVKILHKRSLLGYGLAEYGSAELKKILQEKEITKAIQEKLPSKVFIHKDNLLIKDSL